MEKLMKGLKFKLNQGKKDITSIGYDTIHIIDKCVFRVFDRKTREGDLFHVYEYMLDIIGYDEEGNPHFFQSDEEEIIDEIVNGVYELLH